MGLIRIVSAACLVGAYVLFACTVSSLKDRPSVHGAIPLDGFVEAISHWQESHDQFNYPRCADTEFICVADNILLYQRDNGGWPKNQDPSRLLSEHEQVTILADKCRTDTSLDNHNVFSQITYLAKVYNQTHDEKYRVAAERGVGFLLKYQYENGGWPHSPPRQDDYYPYITVADDVMPGVLTLLRQITEKKDPFQFVDQDLWVRSREALERGDELLLSLQVKQGSKLTGWAGQYHHITLEPMGARSFELVGLVTRESVAVLSYLMSIENPSRDVVRAVESAISWLNASRLYGLRVETISVEKVRYKHHSSDWDTVVTEDSNAPAIWARFYELDSNQPFMANRDGGKVYHLSDVAHERRTGYDWYGDWPNALLENDYPRWNMRHVDK